MDLGFYKYHGTGNDFILIDNREQKWEPDVDRVKSLCDRHYGIGADGLILLNKPLYGSFSMRYFNSDGCESTMCGNGGRCIASLAFSLGIADKEMNFAAVDGEHSALILESLEDSVIVKLKMNDVTIPSNKDEGGIFINTGSPHFVTTVADPSSTDIIAEGRKIRYSERFSRDGTNVDFMKIIDDRNIMVRTYERGVEDETLSCGTGVTASALSAAMILGIEAGSFNIETPGGNLRVYFRKEKDKFIDIWLEGPATFVFRGNIDI